MKKLILTSIFILTFIVQSISATLTAISGNWSNPATWGGVLPQSGDVVIIPEGVTVDVDAMFGTFSNFRLEVYGTLNFIGGRKITLTSNGQVYIAPGGQITGGNGGAQFDIGTYPIYVGGGGGQGTGTLSGPLNCNSTGCNNSAVPIKLISFTASKTNRGVLLEWSTETETNNEFYSIERSSDGINFEVISKVDGAGSSIFRIDYKYIDYDCPNKLLYYRLKQTDINGGYEYFDIISISNIGYANRTPIRITNVLGENVGQDIGGVLIYYYSDGTFDKKYNIKN